MMAKMYYSEEEACQSLGVDHDGLMEYVNSGRLQMYQDGDNNVFKSADVDALAKEIVPGGTDVSMDGPTQISDDAIQLADLDAPEAAPNAPMGKEDTVVTAEGISIFDDEDLGVGEADPMAKTQVAPSLEDEVSLEGLGSGSGLLDLTRESDDTSLGAEVLDSIDAEGTEGEDEMSTGLSSGLSGTNISSGMSELSGELREEAELTEAATQVAYRAPLEPPVYVEAIDSWSGFFNGMTVGVMVIMSLVFMSVLAMFLGDTTRVISGIHNNLTVVVIGVFVGSIIFSIIGLVLGRAYQRKHEAKRISK